MKSLFFILFLLSTTGIQAENKSEIKIAPLEENFSQVKFRNFPKDELIILNVQRPLLGVDEEANRFKITNEGIVFFDKDNQKAGSLEWFPFPVNFLLGEEIILKFKNANNKSFLEYSYIPRPIVQKSKNGLFTMHAKLGKLSPTNYIIQVKDLAGKESLKFSANTSNLSNTKKESLGEGLEVKADQLFGYMPGINDEEAGRATIQLNLDSKDQLQASLNWGMEIVNEFHAFNKNSLQKKPTR